MIGEEIIKFISEPDKMTQPEQVNEVISYLNGLVTDLEEKEFEDRLKVNSVWNELRKTIKTNTETDRAILNTPEYFEHEKTKRSIAKFKRERSALNHRYELLAGKIKHY
jgi:hypothetical protein